jgi:hypothetical protein
VVEGNKEGEADGREEMEGENEGSDDGDAEGREEMEGEKVGWFVGCCVGKKVA